MTTVFILVLVTGLGSSFSFEYIVGVFRDRSACELGREMIQRSVKESRTRPECREEIVQ